MSYTAEDVATGRKLVADIGSRQWQLGDLALKVLPSVPGIVAAGEVLARFADDIGIAPSRLSEYRRVAIAWPPRTRLGVAPYTLHRDLVTEPERYSILQSYVRQCTTNAVRPSFRGLQRYMGKRPTPEISVANRGIQVRQALAEMTTEERLVLILELLRADGELADRVRHPSPDHPRLRDREELTPEEAQRAHYNADMKLADRALVRVITNMHADGTLPPVTASDVLTAAERITVRATTIKELIQGVGVDATIDALLAS